MNELAIVIPYYKADFFEDCLKSISAQTDKRFTVYIGDDCSRDNKLIGLVENYKSFIDIRYSQFNENFGRRNLVAQWTRCVELSDEPWVWLFCDDDLMEEDCVEAFYQTLVNSEDQVTLYRFDTQRIDEEGSLLPRKTNHPDSETSIEFCLRRLRRQTDSYISEYIFSRDKFNQSGGFVDFPRAWASDDATWIKLTGPFGIKKIQGAKVYWRQSGINISMDHSKDRHKKLIASVMFMDFIDKYIDKNVGVVNFEINESVKKAQKEWFRFQIYEALAYRKVFEKITYLFFMVCAKLLIFSRRWRSFFVRYTKQ